MSQNHSLGIEVRVLEPEVLELEVLELESFEPAAPVAEAFESGLSEPESSGAKLPVLTLPGWIFSEPGASELGASGSV